HGCFDRLSTSDADLKDFYGFYKNFVFKQNFSYYHDIHRYEQVHELIRLKADNRFYILLALFHPNNKGFC
ncbi:MAG: hypothetical protein P1P88_11855, partial [Bacteroidales bacterium]|nr:hypothetical protein [Bacteroidales bacterium]